ncbi:MULTISPECIES: Hsp70 family protein [unclassified Coleofasciculus]|uniref:Hsp70 family protein n=1 Tax=unclassified Coleofasciculus TaxID=2692782 RepID=UPI001882E43A|nr:MULTISPECIES: Hsp70 family protein [unclassified Coleofasciculus]MBE9128669.1 Hsp70 family protein [Coleofasciculus sp. LEGE 07081]MBE9147161.1 Hsp70 family protein [Coleofasciculus sp. LEGE 07092]
MVKAVGIDLGTTNSEVAIVENGQARILPDSEGDLILPSCVGLSDTGQLLVGREAWRQYAAAPERTVKSIKRLMGTQQKTNLGDREFLPQEISAMILRALKERAESALAETVQQAVITVPAYFTDAQRQATKEAGEIAGFEVLRILNEPTAAALAYELRTDQTERVLVYDLGGGTFDVSVVELTGEITEVLASHGNNHLGGDDFDHRLQRHLADLFRQEHGVDVPDDLQTNARLLRAAEQVKIELSEHGFATVREPFLSSKGKKALHLEVEIARHDFEELIRPLLEETLEAIDRALSDANLKSNQLERVILVGGSTRIPLVQQMVEEHLGIAPTDSVQPDLCVALGAALQAGVLVGEAVDAILVDVIPHSLGISAAVQTLVGMMPGFFSVIIPRNSVVPVSRSEVYSTVSNNQEIVQVEIFQGENEIAEENVPLGTLRVEDLPARPAGGVQIEVHFDFDLNGILTVTATEKGKGQQGSLVVNNTTTHRLSTHELKASRAKVEALFEIDETLEPEIEVDAQATGDEELENLLEQARANLGTLEAEQAEELQELLTQLEKAIETQETAKIEELREELEDFLYYASNNDEA